MLLRVFAVTDESELGLACLEWVQFMLALDMPLRIASATGAAEIMGDRAGRSPNPWSRLSSCFATPLEDAYINIVMTPMNTWDRFWAVRAQRNVAIVVAAAAFSMEPVRYSFDHVVIGWGMTDPVAGEPPKFLDRPPHEVMRPRTGTGSATWLRPIADNLERFRAVIGG